MLWQNSNVYIIFYMIFILCVHLNYAKSVSNFEKSSLRDSLREIPRKYFNIMTPNVTYEEIESLLSKSSLTKDNYKEIQKHINSFKSFSRIIRAVANYLIPFKYLDMNWRKSEHLQIASIDLYQLKDSHLNSLLEKSSFLKKFFEITLIGDLKKFNNDSEFIYKAYNFDSTTKDLDENCVFEFDHDKCLSAMLKIIVGNLDEKSREAYDGESTNLKKLKEYIKPFTNIWDNFNFRSMMAFFYCGFALGELGWVSGLDLHCDVPIKSMNGYEILYYKDIIDKKELFFCARLAFCPDPCCAYAFYMDLPKEVGESKNLSVWQNHCNKHWSNPCSTFGDGTCRTVSVLDKEDPTDLLHIECQCLKGYRYNRAYNMCIDIDECAENSHNCRDQKEVCYNLPGKFMCLCESGYRRSKAFKKDELSIEDLRSNDYDKPFEWIENDSVCVIDDFGDEVFSGDPNEIL